MSLCLAAGALTATIAANSFTLAWTHSIEQIRWEEDWRVEAGTLHLVAARVRGSGAGMEIPEEAELKDGVWHYWPLRVPIENLTLAHSPYVAGYQLCIAGECRALVAHLPGLPGQATIELKACTER
jgi:hypothetical protein